jgi:hypothetical protein
MKKKKISMFRLTNKRFAVAANLLVIFILLHNFVGVRFGIPWFFNIFVLVLAYFIASGAYSLYVDVIGK